MDVIKQLCDVRRRLGEAASAITAPCQSAEHRERLAMEIQDLTAIVDKITVQASITAEALNPVFETGNGRGGVLSVLDLCYNAFMIGRNMENRENGGRCDWFNDTAPLMIAGVDRLKKETTERMEYARRDRDRLIARAVSESPLPGAKMLEGAKSLYKSLDEGIRRPGAEDFEQAPVRTQMRYYEAFATAIAASDFVGEDA